MYRPEPEQLEFYSEFLWVDFRDCVRIQSKEKTYQLLDRNTYKNVFN